MSSVITRAVPPSAWLAPALAAAREAAASTLVNPLRHAAHRCLPLIFIDALRRLKNSLRPPRPAP